MLRFFNDSWKLKSKIIFLCPYSFLESILKFDERPFSHLYLAKGKSEMREILDLKNWLSQFISCFSTLLLKLWISDDKLSKKNILSRIILVFWSIFIGVWESLLSWIWMLLVMVESPYLLESVNLLSFTMVFDLKLS